MSAHLCMRLSRPLRGIRVHSAPDAPTAGERVRWLVDLRDRERRAEEDSQVARATMAAIQQACQNVPVQVGQQLDQLGALVTELGVTLARELVGAALDRGLVDPAPIVRRLLDGVAAGTTEAPLTVHLSPQDLATVVAGLEAHDHAGETRGRINFVVDPTLARGAARIETDGGRLLYDPREVLERMADELRKEVGP